MGNGTGSATVNIGGNFILTTNAGIETYISTAGNSIVISLEMLLILLMQWHQPTKSFSTGLDPATNMVTL